MKKDRLKELLYNAIVLIERDNSDLLVSSIDDEYEWFEEELGITKEELNEIGVDWLNACENDIDEEMQDYEEEESEGEM